MKNDVLQWAEGLPTVKNVSKETLNHRGIIEYVSGLDALHDTKRAYLSAYRALGIDIVNRVPLENATPPTPVDEVRKLAYKPYNSSYLGLYDTFMRHTYECEQPEDVWDFDPDTIFYDDLITPVPHPCRADDIRAREAALGEIGLYYPMLYTTLFMWGVEVLGWEVFMLAAFGDPDRFHDHFIIPCVGKSQAIVDEISRTSECPFVFVHDDLASGTGPVFPPAWYDDYIFPHYPEIWSPAKSRGKKVIFVADGNMTAFLPRLVESGVDGIQFENPATPLEAVIEHFSECGRFMIGGIDTVLLTMGNPEEIKNMVEKLHEKTVDIPGFALSSCGGLHGNLPLENLVAYFDARSDIGATPKNWRSLHD